MLFYFDESGDYAFPDGAFDCYVQAALICPDGHLSEVDRFVSARRTAWGVDELHATGLEPHQRLEVARFLGESDCQLLAHVTDTTLITASELEEFRLAQAATLKRDLDWYRRESAKTRGAPAEEIEEWYLRALKRGALHPRFHTASSFRLRSWSLILERSKSRSLSSTRIDGPRASMTSTSPSTASCQARWRQERSS